MRNKILVVDDDVKSKEIFDEALENFMSEGGELLIADNLKVGLRIIAEHDPQLIFISTQVRDFNQLFLEPLKATVFLLSKDDLIKNRFPTLTKPLTTQVIAEKCWDTYKHHAPVDTPLM